jgi:type VI protein secretion system component VasF
MFKKKTDRKTADSGWGGGDEFWGESAPGESFGESARAEVMAAAPPAAKKPLIEHLEPLFLYVCQQHRIVRESAGAGVSIDEIRNEVVKRIDAIRDAARFDPILKQHFEKLQEPIYWYVDSTFGSPDNKFPFRQKWNDKRLGDYGKDGNLSGDDAFFDELETELKENASDETSNERLTFYYLAIGLGFTGRFFKKTPEHRTALKEFMERIYPRVIRYLDTDSSGRITPESYRFTDKRDFIAPSRDKPMVFFSAFLLLLATLLIGYIHWYNEAKVPIQRAVEAFK